MKKIICALILMSMIICLSGCDDSENKSSKSSSISESSESSVSEVDETLEESEITEDVNSVDDTDTGLDGNVYTGGTYKLTVNDKWELTSEGSNSLDCTFNYIAGSTDDEAYTCFGVQTIPGAGSESIDDMVDPMIETYNALDGYSVEGSSKTTFNDMEACEIILVIENGESPLKMRQTIFKNGDNMYAINATAVETIYDEMMSEIDNIISSFEFK